MGSEDPWFWLPSLAILLLLVAAVVFITIKIGCLIVTALRRKR